MYLFISIISIALEPCFFLGFTLLNSCAFLSFFFFRDIFSFIFLIEYGLPRGLGLAKCRKERGLWQGERRPVLPGQQDGWPWEPDEVLPDGTDGVLVPPEAPDDDRPYPA